jgi:outer membrane protein assembly factor BamD
MKRNILFYSLVILLSSCGSFVKVQKSTDYDYKYEQAKQYFIQGQYNKASLLLSEQIAMLKGSDKAEESLYMLGMCYYYEGDFETAQTYFKKYYQSYPKGVYAQESHFYSGKALYETAPDPRLDQSTTILAIGEFQSFLDVYPDTKLKDETQQMIFQLQDKLAEKELYSAKLYYDLGNYFGNCTSGGSNYQACVVTAQNALKEYPYSKRREDFSMLILRAKYGLAQQSVESKRIERFRDTVDEYYGFINDYPESKYLKEAKKIFADADRIVKNKS